MTADEYLRFLSVVAAVIKSAGELEGRVRLQKTLYLLQRVGLQELHGLEFHYHHYGPYSSSIAEALNQGVATGVFIEKADSFDEEWQRYRYSVSDEAAEILSQVDTHSIRVLKKVLSRVKYEHWRTLELAATIDFIADAERLKSRVALRRALALKPACKPFEKSALKLLEDLQSLSRTHHSVRTKASA